MRLAAWGAVALIGLGASPAAAQPFDSIEAFLGKPAKAGKVDAGALRDAAFADKLIDRETYVEGKGPVVRQSGSVTLAQSPKGRVDSLRIHVDAALNLPAGVPLDLTRDDFKARDIDVTLVRSWPEAFSGSTETFMFDLSPHAGLGFSSRGGQAEAGAVLRVGPKTRGERALQQLRDMGVKDGLSAYGDQGRWYFFAAASGTAVGLNMVGGEGGWSRDGWSMDQTTDLVGDAQVGVAWRKGDMQSSFGVIHREVKGRHMIFGQTTRDDTVAAFTFSLRPQ